MTLLFRLLGPIEVVAEATCLPLGGPRQRRLLAVLAFNCGRHVPMPALIEAVWDGAPPASAGATVQSYISRLRGVLTPHAGPAALTAAAGGYVLTPDVEVDVSRFEQLRSAGLDALERGDAAEAAVRLRNALSLYRGPLAADLACNGWLELHRHRLAAARAAAEDALYDAEIRAGNATRVVPELQERVVADPLREVPQRQLIAALEACGRQTEALTAYAAARSALRDALGVEPSEQLQALHRSLLAQPDGHPRHHRPAVSRGSSPLLGREEDLRAVRAALARSAIVTITGPAGAGKTRLALEVAHAVELAGGSAFVELAAAENGGDVARAVARALGVLEQPHVDLATSIGEVMSRREALLVLDNCEHVADACADLVTALRTAAPDVQMLVTSQQSLRVDAEVVYALLPLAVPPPGSSLDVIHAAPAVRLFEQHASAVQPGFSVGADNAAVVAQICRDLDGLPLALELAAATVRAVDVTDLAARLPDRFAVLSRGARSSPSRHRSLAAAVSWGYYLLDMAERDAFAQLSVFAGGFTLDGAEQVVRVAGRDGTGDVLDLLTGLVDKSFVRADLDRRRYSLLETLRIHGAARLQEQDGQHETRTRHAQAVLRLCQTAASELRGPHQLGWVGRLDDERDNVAAALRWALESRDAEVGLGIVATLWSYWWRNGHIPEGAQWARQVLNAVGGPAELRAAALVGTSHLAWKLGEFAWVEQACADALDLLGPVGAQTPLAAAARGVSAMVLRDRGDIAGARRLLDQVLQEYVALGERWGEAATLNMLVSVDRDSSDLDLAAARLERSARMFDALGDLWGQAWSAWLTGRVSTRRGDLPLAAERLAHSVVLARELRHGFGVVLGLAGLAGVAAASGDAAGAARLLGATDALEHAMGFPVRVIEREDSARDVAVTRAALGDRLFQQYWGEGYLLTPDQALATAWPEIASGEDAQD
jgi:predicted ATPase/DNA-binding SARP family transcriptional activator